MCDFVYPELFKFKWLNITLRNTEGEHNKFTSVTHIRNSRTRILKHKVMLTKFCYLKYWESFQFSWNFYLRQIYDGSVFQFGRRFDKERGRFKFVLRKRHLQSKTFYYDQLHCNVFLTFLGELVNIIFLAKNI